MKMRKREGRSEFSPSPLGRAGGGGGGGGSSVTGRGYVQNKNKNRHLLNKCIGNVGTEETKWIWFTKQIITGIFCTHKNQL